MLIESNIVETNEDEKSQNPDDTKTNSLKTPTKNDCPTLDNYPQGFRVDSAEENITESPPIEIVSDSEDDGDIDDENSDDTDALQVALESEFVWAETEAWVEAELLAEEEAWRDLLPPEMLAEENVESLSPQPSPRNLFLGVDISPDLETKESVSVLTPEISEDEESVPPLVSPLALESPYKPKSPSRLIQRFQAKLFSIHPFRRLHEKLSSPERGTKLTTEQVKLRNEIRQSTAESNRDKSVREIKQKAMVVSNRIKASELREAQRIALAEQVYRNKLEEAEKRHHEYIKSIRGRAWNENTKVLLSLSGFTTDRFLRFFLSIV